MFIRSAITTAALISGLIIFAPSLMSAQQVQPQLPPQAQKPTLSQIIPGPPQDQNVPPIPSPPTQHGPPPTADQIKHRGLVPDNLAQQCTALQNKQTPPADAFSATSRPIPPGFGHANGAPLCSLISQFADQAHPHGPPMTPPGLTR